jgi:hypothetical protein
MTVSADAQSRMQGTAASGFESVSQVYEPGPEVETMAEENTHSASTVLLWCFIESVSPIVPRRNSCPVLLPVATGASASASSRPSATTLCPTSPS